MLFLGDRGTFSRLPNADYYLRKARTALSLHVQRYIQRDQHGSVG